MQSGKQVLTCATYNILRGRYAEHIVRNIGTLIEQGADIICLQEAERDFETELEHFLRERKPDRWAVEYAHAERGGDIALLWNTERVSLRRSRVIFLPSLGRPSHLQRLHGRKNVYQRLALIAEFVHQDTVFSVSNVHLSWEGGMRHRFKQIRVLREALRDTPRSALVCGDFNTIGPRLMNKLQAARAQRLLGAGFSDAHPRLRWSFDISCIDPAGWRGAAHLQRVGMKLRSRLDYMFARGLQAVAADMYDLPGSDHRPLIATFELSPSPTRAVDE